ncbi:MAG: P-II family nitrogen regulator [Phenylobacterium sp.]|jgi:nitrogen regulatory protein PII|uniref:P-II family nitrogen regulator n=1 Tax=Phenylobacterium sp. TaxID=1871053 RepID=UPI00391CB6CC
MQTARRKKLEIVVEALVLRRVEEMLGEAGVRGWTVLPSLEGAGTGGGWSSGDFAPGQEKRLIFAVVSDETAQKALERLAAFFADYPGVVCVSEVEVLRGERFL